MEPPDLWQNYIEPRFRDRAIRIAIDPADGMEMLMIDNQPMLKGVLAGLGGANLPRETLFVPGQKKYSTDAPVRRTCPRSGCGCSTNGGSGGSGLSHCRNLVGYAFDDALAARLHARL